MTSAFQRLLPLHLASAVVWAVIVQWPWGGWLFHALGALAALHLIGPFWAHLVSRQAPSHRAFLVGPIALFAIDIAFLVFAWTNDLWGDLTTVFVPLLAGLGVCVLIYSAFVMALLGRLRNRRADA